jgi:hypothetical protein
VSETLENPSPDGKKSPAELGDGKPATVALPRAENPIPPKVAASSKISSRILGGFLIRIVRTPRAAQSAQTHCEMARIWQKGSGER